MQVYEIDPLSDLRWMEIVEKHPNASIFHSRSWLESLRLTYDYKPIVFTTTPPDTELCNGMAFCLVQSWLTGQRLVSLPFSDHCDPLYRSTDQLTSLLGHIEDALDRRNWKYIEFRPANPFSKGVTEQAELRPSKRYVLHKIDLQLESADLFKNLDKDSIQRRIRRAGRAGLVEKCGRDEGLLRDFYALLVTTRRRHHVPPQPYQWFQNLVKCFGEALEVRAAYKDQTAVAAILTLRFKKTAYYKYGCSDASFNHLGATPLLLWNAISSAKGGGAQEFDLGRTDEDNIGLITFKDKWGARSQPLVYSRFTGSTPSVGGEEWKLKVVKQVCSCLPERVLAAAGTLIYRHIG